MQPLSNGTPSHLGSLKHLEILSIAARRKVTNSAAGESDEEEPNSRLAICGKTFERATQCAMAAMDRNPVEFASYLPYFLPLYSNNALLTMDAAAVHRIRPKRRILLMQFLARALLCPVYQTEWLDAHAAGEAQS